MMVARDRGGLTPEEIAASIYPTLTLAQVYAALAYCEDRRAKIERAVADEARAIDEFRSDHPELVRDRSSQKDSAV